MALSKTVTMSCLLVAWAALGDAQTPPKTELSKGLSYEKRTVGKAGSGIEMHLLKIDADSGFAAQVVVPKDRASSKSMGSSPGVSALLMADYLRETKSTIILSGGYVNDYTALREVGYVRADNKEQSPQLKSWFVDALYCEGKDVLIDKLDAGYAVRDNYKSCLQAGPMLVYGGEALLQNDKEDANRGGLFSSQTQHMFICATKTALVFGFVQAATMRSLAKALSKSGDGFGCERAMRLPSGGMLINGGTIGTDTLSIPNAIAVMTDKR